MANFGGDAPHTMSRKTEIRALREAAERGENEAMLELARAYDAGDGVPASPRSAYRWYLRAAETGHVDGMYATGLSLVEGDGDRGGGGVTVALDVDEDLLEWHLAAFGDCLDDPQIGLVGDQQIEICSGEPRLRQHLRQRSGHGSHGMAENLLPFHADAMQLGGDILGAGRVDTAAAGVIEQTAMGTVAMQTGLQQPTLANDRQFGKDNPTAQLHDGGREHLVHPFAANVLQQPVPGRLAFQASVLIRRAIHRANHLQKLHLRVGKWFAVHMRGQLTLDDQIGIPPDGGAYLGVEIQPQPSVRLGWVESRVLLSLRTSLMKATGSYSVTEFTAWDGGSCTR